MTYAITSLYVILWWVVLTLCHTTINKLRRGKHCTTTCKTLTFLPVKCSKQMGHVHSTTLAAFFFPVQAPLKQVSGVKISKHEKKMKLLCIC